MNEALFIAAVTKYICYPVMFRKGIRIIFVKGDSGVGKTSFSILLGITITRIMAELFKVNQRSMRNKIRDAENFRIVKEYFENPVFDIKNQVVYEPFEYKQKLEWFLNNPHPVFVIDELRFLVPAKLWRNIISLTFADINATIRSVKASKFGYGGVFIYNSQFFSDIIKDTRRTVKFIFDMRIDPSDLTTYAYFIENYEWKVGENYMTREKKVRLDTEKYLFTLGRIFTTKLPDAIDIEIEKISSEAKSRINKMKQDKIEKELMKEFGIRGDIK